MGSSDLAAAARSVFSVRYEEQDGVHVIKHVKSSLVQKSPELAFPIGRDGAIEFLGEYEAGASMLAAVPKEGKIGLAVAASTLPPILAGVFLFSFLSS